VVDEFSARGVSASRSPERRPGYAEWIAFGAVVAGSIGAVVGAAKCARTHARDTGVHARSAESAMVTAPHGDKLSSAL
jgi:hypothetical protein